MEQPAKQEALERIREIESWKDKAKRLKEQKGMTRKDLCEKHGICPIVFCNSINFKTTPRQKTINQIKEAFEAEGIV